MNTKRLWRLIGPLFLCLTLLVMGSGSVYAQEDPASDAIEEVVTASDDEIRAYWGAEQQMAAIPLDIMVAQQSVPDTLIPSEIEPAVSEPPTAPALADQSLTFDSGIQLQAFSVPYPYPFPVSTVGKVFFTDPATGSKYVCSGTAVTSKNKSTVDTAGHCLAAGGEKRFYKNWTFCPQYFKVCPKDYLWTARSLFTHSKWYKNGFFAYDYGAAVVKPNSKGKLVNVIGGAGWTYNQPYKQNYVALGFPAGAPFDGTRMWFCASSLYRSDSPSPGPKAVGITCDMTGGSSGGGWLIKVKDTFGYVNGHNDYKYTNDPAHMYSPYYGKDWYKVFNQAQKS